MPGGGGVINLYFSIIYHHYDGTSSSKSLSIQSGLRYVLRAEDLPNQTRQGFKFINWTDSVGNEYSVGDKLNVSANSTVFDFFEKWEMKLPPNIIVKRYVDGLADVRIIIDSDEDISIFGTDFLPGSEIFCDGEGTPTYTLNAQHEWEKCDASETGVGSYNDLPDKPSIEGHTLNSGSNTAASLGLATINDLNVVRDTADDAASSIGQVSTDVSKIQGDISDLYNIIPTTPSVYSFIGALPSFEDYELDFEGLIKSAISTALTNMVQDGYRGNGKAVVPSDLVPLSYVSGIFEGLFLGLFGGTIATSGPDRFSAACFIISTDNEGNASVFRTVGASTNMFKALTSDIDPEHGSGYSLPSFNISLEGTMLKKVNDSLVPVRIALNLICEKEEIEVPDPVEPSHSYMYWNPVELSITANAEVIAPVSSTANTIVLSGDFANGSTPALPSGFTFPANSSSDFSAVLEIEGYGMESGNHYELEIPFFAYFSDETDGDRIYFGENPDASNPDGILGIDNNTDTGVRTLSNFYAPGYPDAEWSAFTLTITDARTGS